MSHWIVAGVQMDGVLGDRAANLQAMIDRLDVAAGSGARVVVFPECALNGYGFRSRADALHG